MKLPTPTYAITGYVAAATLTLGFGAGWYVESLRWDASLLKVEKAAIKQERKQQASVEKQATSYEKERTDGAVQHTVRQERIRTIYRDREVPGSCAAPDSVVRVLNDAIAEANSRVGGQPRDGLPTAPVAPDPADRPRSLPVGRNDDRALRGLWLEAPAHGPGMADEQVSVADTEPLAIPDPAFAMEYHP